MLTSYLKDGIKDANKYIGSVQQQTAMQSEHVFGGASPPSLTIDTQYGTNWIVCQDMRFESSVYL